MSLLELTGSAFATFALPGLLVLSFQLQLTCVLHAPRRLASGRIHRHLPLDSLGAELSERILYIDVVFSTRFEEYHIAILLAELLAVQCAYFALLFQVDLISDYQKWKSV